MSLPRITKDRPVNSNGLGFLSAQWKIKDLPGVYLLKTFDPQGPVGSNSWQFINPKWSGGYEKSELSGFAKQVLACLKDQRFATRREALQALHAAMQVAEVRS